MAPGRENRSNDHFDNGIFSYSKLITLFRAVTKISQKPFLAYSENGLTPLYFAAQNGRGDIVKLLLENGADPKKKWKILSVGGLVFISRSPLTAARQNGHDEIVKMIKKSIKDRRVSSEHFTVVKHSS